MADYVLHSTGTLNENSLARVYCAARSLSEPTLNRKLIDLSNMNFVIFELDRDNKFAEELRKSLLIEFSGSRMVKKY